MLQISFWLAITAVILFITSELVSTKYGIIKININKKRLKAVAYIIGVLFLATVIIRVTNLLF